RMLDGASLVCVDARGAATRLAGVRARDAVGGTAVGGGGRGRRVPVRHRAMLEADGQGLADGRRGRRAGESHHRRTVARIRHPIYAFSILLMACTAVV